MAKKVQTIDVNSLDKDIVIPANTKNAEIYFKNLNNFNDLTFSGGSAENPATNNLTILVNGHKITLTNYFAKNGSFAVKTIKTDSETTQSVNLIDYVNEHQIRGVYQNIVNAMTKTVNGTVFDDIITPLGDKQTVNAGNGNDLIYADGGNDTLIGGLGTNEVKFEYYATPFPEQKSFGQDIIKLTKGETLNLNIKYDDSTPVNLTFSKGSGKGANDLIITNDANPEDKITIQNYYGKETGATVLINGKDLSEESADFITYNFNEDSIIKSSTVKGSALADTIDASDAPQQTKKSGKKTVNTNLVIDAGAGDDTITGSAFGDTIKSGNGSDTIYGSGGNDTITGGKGTNSIIYSASNCGEDTINLTKGEILNITGLDFDGIETANILKSGKNKNDLLITSKYGTITLKDYYKKDTGATVTINGIDLINMPNLPDSDPLMVQFRSYVNSITGANTFNADTKITTYTGTALADRINAKDMTARTDKKGNVLADKGLTINSGLGNDRIVATNFNDVINAGAGDDVIEGGQGDDKLTGGKGSDTFVFTSGDGIDTITDADSNNKIVINDVDAGNLRYAKNGNNFEIYYDSAFNENQKIIIKDFFKKKASQRINNLSANGTPVLLSDIIDNNEYFITGSGTIKGTDNNDKFIGSSKNDKIYCYKGDDEIFCSEGSDTIYITNGSKKVHLTKGSGNDTIVYTKTSPDLSLKLVFEDYSDIRDLIRNTRITSANNNDLTIYYGDNDSITIKDYIKNDIRSNSPNIFNLRADNVLIQLNNANNEENEESYTYSLETFLDSVPANKYFLKIPNMTYSDYRYEYDEGGSGNDKLYAYSTDNIINGGKGKNTIYLANYSFSVIQNGKGEDTLIFEEGTLSDINVRYDNNDLIIFCNTDNYDDDDNNDVRIEAIIKDYKINKTTSVKTIKAGSKSISLKSLINDLDKPYTITDSTKFDIPEKSSLVYGNNSDNIIKIDPNVQFIHSELYLDFEANNTLVFEDFSNYKLEKNENDLILKSDKNRNHFINIKDYFKYEQNAKNITLTTDNDSIIYDYMIGDNIYSVYECSFENLFEHSYYMSKPLYMTPKGGEISTLDNYGKQEITVENDYTDDTIYVNSKNATTLIDAKEGNDTFIFGKDFGDVSIYPYSDGGTVLDYGADHLIFNEYDISDLNFMTWFVDAPENGDDYGYMCIYNNKDADIAYPASFLTLSEELYNYFLNKKDFDNITIDYKYFRDLYSSDGYHRFVSEDTIYVTDKNNYKYDVMVKNGTIEDTSGNDIIAAGMGASQSKEDRVDTFIYSSGRDAYYGNYGNDTYNVTNFDENSYLFISDNMGQNSLNLLTVNSINDLNFFFNIDKNANFLSDDLTIFLKNDNIFEENGCIKIHNYFSAEDESNIHSAKINIYNKDGEEISLTDKLDSLKSTIAGWLSEKDYTSVENVLNLDCENKDAIVGQLAEQFLNG